MDWQLGADLVESRSAAEISAQSTDGDLLRLVVETVQDHAILMLDVEGRVATWNLGAQRIKGYAAGEIIGRHFSVFYPPEDTAAGLPEQLLEQARAEGRVESEGWRLCKDGTRFWGDVIITALRDERGTLRGYGKVTRDLTERHRGEQDLRAGEDRFRIAFIHAAVPISTIGLEDDNFGRILTANAAYGAMLGLPVEDLLGRVLDEFVLSDDLQTGVDTPLRRLASGATERVQFERRYVRADGEVVAALVTDALFVDRQGRRVAIGQILDISERKRFEQELLHRAEHDALTGLFNRQRFDFELDRQLKHVQRYGSGSALLSLDLDGFKYVNDSLGHAAGDELVTAVSRALKRALRSTDIMARTGGDEFAVILPEADEQVAVTVAEKLLTAVRQAGTIVRDGRRVQVTSSIGITVFNAETTLEAQDLVVEADIAMYDAKDGG